MIIFTLRYITIYNIDNHILDLDFLFFASQNDNVNEAFVGEKRGYILNIFGVGGNIFKLSAETIGLCLTETFTSSCFFKNDYFYLLAFMIFLFFFFFAYNIYTLAVI